MTKGINRALAIATLLVAYFVSDDSDAVANSSKNYRYVLVMSENDALCKPLTHVYNNLLRKWFENPNRTELAYFRDGSIIGAIPPMTDFEVTNPKALAKAGLFAPKPVLVKPDRTLYELDIRNDGDVRLVSVHDDVGLVWPEDRMTFVDVFKKGITIQNVHLFDQPEKRWGPGEINPALLSGNLDTRYLYDFQKKNGNGAIKNGYILRKWKSKSGIIHMSPGINTTRIFIDKNNIVYFIRNSSAIAPIRYDPDGTIVVYIVTDQGPRDICYITITSRSLENLYD